MAVMRRCRKFSQGDDPECMTAQLNGTTHNGFALNRGGLRDGERIVSSYVLGGYVYVLTEELIMGPVPGKVA